MTMYRGLSNTRPARLAATGVIAAAMVGLLTAPATAQGGPDYYYTPLWQGSYAGAHLGFGDAGAADGIIGGLQIGYNWQAGRIVYGLEADFTWSDVSYGETFAVCNTPACVSARVDASIDWLATVRGRVGYLVQPGLLPYVTLGFGIVSGSASASLNAPGSRLDPLNADGTDPDFIYGIGLESWLSPTTLWRIEYLAFADTDLDVIRAGFSFKLGN